MKRKAIEQGKKDAQDTQVSKERCLEWNCAVCKEKSTDLHVFQILGCSSESIALYVCDDCCLQEINPRIHYIGLVDMEFIQSIAQDGEHETQDGEHVYCPETPERDENEPVDDTIIEGTMYTDSIDFATQLDDTTQLDDMTQLDGTTQPVYATQPNDVTQPTEFTMHSIELATQPEEIISTQQNSTQQDSTQQDDDLNSTQQEEYESMIDLNNTTVSLDDGTECTRCVLCNDATYSSSSQTCGKFYCLNK